jgi:DNA-binding CsgD family transcriptional regulator
MVDDGQLKGYYVDDGLSIRDIAEKAGMPFQTVRLHLLKSGVVFRRTGDYHGRHVGRRAASEYMPVIRNLVALGKNDVEIGKALHARPATVSAWRGRAGIEAVAKRNRKRNLDNARIRDMMDAGLSIKEIAVRLACSWNTAYLHVKAIRAGRVKLPETDEHVVNSRILAMEPVKDGTEGGNSGYVPLHLLREQARAKSGLTEAQRMALRIAKENLRKMRHEAYLQRKEKKLADERFAKASIHSLLSAEDLSSIAKNRANGSNNNMEPPAAKESPSSPARKPNMFSRIAMWFRG